MKNTLWSFVLQWSRVGINALLFLCMARYLSLTEIGTFAAAFAPVRLIQTALRSGIGDAAVALPATRPVLFRFALFSGLGFGALLLFAGLYLGTPVGPYLCALAPVPILHAMTQLPEAYLRRSLRLRALALRTMAAQSVAALCAIVALIYGAGAGALVLFTLLGAALTALLSWMLAPVRPGKRPSARAFRLTAGKSLELALRDLGGGAIMPLMQILVTVAFGLGPAGAFQIAARLIALTDALIIAPLRYITLPLFARLSAVNLSGQLATALTLSGWLSALCYPLVWFLAPIILPLAIGPEHSQSTLPLLAPLCLSGAISALAMPLTQALTATRETRLPFLRGIATLGLTLVLGLLSSQVSLSATIYMIPLAAILIWGLYLVQTARHFSIPASRLLSPLLLPALSALLLTITYPNTVLVTATLFLISLGAALTLASLTRAEVLT